MRASMTTARRFRKKSVVIEAMQFTDLNSYLAIVAWMKNCRDTSALADEVRYSSPIMTLHTLEGTMAANPGDWIIRGIKNEFYPCRPDIFEASYEEELVTGT